MKAVLAALLAIGLMGPVLADSPIEARDVDGDGWAEWVIPGDEGSFETPGQALLQLSKGHDLSWLIAESEKLPPSQSVTAEIARRLWQEGRREESLEYYSRARSMDNTELALETAHRLFFSGRRGEALVEVARVGYLGWYRQALAGDPFTRRLVSDWQPSDDGTALIRGEARLEFQPLGAPMGRPVKLGTEPATLDAKTGTLQVASQNLQFKITPERMVTTLASELAGPQGMTQHLGDSVQGRPITGCWLGDGEESVIFFGAFHGDEPESTLVCNRLMEYLKKNPELLEGRTAVIVPVVNPDGLHGGTRLNARQVDLNRNFPTSNWSGEGKGGDYWGGPAAASEPETKVVMELLKRVRPARIITIHCPYKCVNYDGPAEKLAAIMAEENGYKIEPSIGYPTPGSFGTYAGIEAKIPTITLELPPTGEEDVWPDNQQALVRALRGE